MVEEIVNNIIEAEDKAAQIVKDAKEEAKTLLSDAQKASEARRAACVKDGRARLDECGKQAVKNARAVYDGILQKGKEEAAKLSEEYEKNVDKGAAMIVAALTA